ncbi:HAD family hydrolase [Octadecabacter sp. G9-8]|uniref:phosphoglycolate phosphatase n=1 Tax=Octadecabacter dasysiphoniae TaxID=2909341 RepID=A0ABS9CU83_9RHOB|nr:HAD family hydrolase [Octadecabacter dasysiphoniae]MCF2869969.1 HAD family hydrolase [Octadecabacter dasysiphoniae]
MTSLPIQGLIFDKDGTLFDFNATWGAFTGVLLVQETMATPEALDPLAQALGYDLTTGLFRKDSLVIAGTVDEVVEAAMPFLAETDPEALAKRFKAAAILAPQIEVTPLKPLFTQMRDAGLILGIATNDAEIPARANLGSVDVTSFFDFIAGFDSGFGGKPAPGQLHGFCEQTGLHPSVCAMVGDSTHDLHAGRAAGMATVAVLTGVAEHDELALHADVVLSSIADLPVWLGLQS